MLFGQYLNSHRMVKRPAKTLIRLQVCTGWSEPLLVAHTTLLEISCHGSFVVALEQCLCQCWISLWIMNQLTVISTTHVECLNWKFFRVAKLRFSIYLTRWTDSHSEVGSIRKRVLCWGSVWIVELKDSSWVYYYYFQVCKTVTRL